MVLSIDPGNEVSAFVVYDGGVLNKGIVKNDDLLEYIVTQKFPTVVIEMVASYGMAVGATVFDTVLWIGRFYQQAILNDSKVELVYRKDVKMHHCHSMQAKDTNIRQALIDRFNPGLQPRKKPTGVLAGLHDDEWSAFAIAIYYTDKICM